MDKSVLNENRRTISGDEKTQVQSFGFVNGQNSKRSVVSSDSERFPEFVKISNQINGFNGLDQSTETHELDSSDDERTES